MKNQIKSIVNIAACMFITTLSSNASAQATTSSTVTLTGTVGAAGCTVGVYDDAATGGQLSGITANSLGAGILTAANPAGTISGSTPFWVRVPAGCSAGATSKWNVGFSAPATLNVITNGGTATGVSFDIASFSSGSATPLTSISAIAPTTVAAARTQNGYSTDTAVGDAQQYSLRYIKTAAAATAVGAGSVTATLTISTFLP